MLTVPFSVLFSPLHIYICDHSWLELLDTLSIRVVSPLTIAHDLCLPVKQIATHIPLILLRYNISHIDGGICKSRFTDKDKQWSFSEQYNYNAILDPNLSYSALVF